MTLKEIGEFGFIERIRQGCLIRPEGVVRAIGDDAAAFASSADQVTLLTTDLLVERVHFLRHAISGLDLGHKALAVNLSDIAAMGGDPREAFVSIAIPADCGLAYLDAIYGGLTELAAEFEVNILGGDTTASKGDLIINVAVTGRVHEAELLRRDGARPGDLLVTTGPLGESRAGLHLILNQIPADTPGFRRLLDVHRRPQPHLREGRFLATSGAVHAAMDVSDGLGNDLAHILKQSAVGARIFADRLPISRDLKAFCHSFDFDPVQFAVAGGEDYVLLGAVDPRQAKAVMAAYQETFGASLFPIGEITTSGVGAVELVAADGRVMEIRDTGWDHFGAAP
jgi:thiamine-monophosphate kinase